MSKCPEEGCRNDCPLKQVGEWNKNLSGG
jgi:hypothetical protein